MTLRDLRKERNYLESQVDQGIWSNDLQERYDCMRNELYFKKTSK